MRYAGLIENDFVNGEGVCVTVFLQGCPHHCPGCHNPETWDYDGGTEIDESDLLNKIINAISKNSIQRNLSISGGEPLCNENSFFVKKLIEKIKIIYPSIKICCWTGYEYDELFNQNNQDIKFILNNVNILVTGPYIKEQRDITLKLRGSSNQKIYRLN